jgi:hypothetical protein
VFATAKRFQTNNDISIFIVATEQLTQ